MFVVSLWNHFSFQTLINMAYCCLILFGKLIQQVVFGHLRVSEHQVIISLVLPADCYCCAYSVHMACVLWQISVPNWISHHMYPNRPTTSSAALDMTSLSAFCQLQCGPECWLWRKREAHRSVGAKQNAAISWLLNFDLISRSTSGTTLMTFLDFRHRGLPPRQQSAIDMEL